jgi:hypothetical protein
MWKHQHKRGNMAVPFNAPRAGLRDFEDVPGDRRRTIEGSEVGGALPHEVRSHMAAEAHSIEGV